MIMASILNEYISKGWRALEYKAELKALIDKYNDLTGRNLFVYAADFNKVMDFICETRDGRYTAEKPDLTSITYTRMEIQEGDATNIFSDGFEEVVLYGVSY